MQSPFRGRPASRETAESRAIIGPARVPNPPPRHRARRSGRCRPRRETGADRATSGGNVGPFRGRRGPAGPRCAPAAPVADGKDAVLHHAHGRCPGLRPMGAASGRRRLDRHRRLLPGAALPLFPRRRLRRGRRRPRRRAPGAGGARLGIGGTPLCGRGASVRGARRSHRRRHAGALRAGRIPRQPAAEVHARRLLRVRRTRRPGVAGDRRPRAPPRVGGARTRRRRAGAHARERAGAGGGARGVDLVRRARRTPRTRPRAGDLWRRRRPRARASGRA